LFQPANELTGQPKNDAEGAAAPADSSRQRRWAQWLGGVMTLAMVAGVAYQLFGQGWAAFYQSVPTSPWFYLAFIALYLSLPLGDYVIFRRLWGIPLEGLGALIKKRIANEVLFGYSGEAYFYAWAKARARNVAAPFGAVKDVSILSALSGNAVTLVLIAMSVPFVAKVGTAQLEGLGLSALFVVAVSVPFWLFRRRIFSLPVRERWYVFWVHIVRLVAGTVLLALVWALALPQVPLGAWLTLSAVRMIVGRVPFVPNKDLLFANFVGLLGLGQGLPMPVALIAGLTLVVHVLVLGAFPLAGLFRSRR